MRDECILSHLFPPAQLTRAAITVALMIVSAMGGCTPAGLMVNNVHHMTVERATTARISKPFRVLDAETRKPVPRAELVIIHDFDWMDDWVFAGATDERGVAAFRLAREYLHLLTASAEAEGYLGRSALHFGERREPGVGSLSDDPVDIYLYHEPAPKVGLRAPAGFRGAFTYVLGKEKYDFPFPPDFPPGQRIWWSEVVPNGQTVVEPPPPLAGVGWFDGNPIQLVKLGDELIPIPEPGAKVDGIAAWHIGVLEPNGPWGGDHWLVVIGDRNDALAKAKELWQRLGEGEQGIIYNGWVRLIAPDAKVGPGGAYAATRRNWQTRRR